jgi:ABC-type lipoprotein export system ATPase subunit
LSQIIVDNVTKTYSIGDEQLDAVCSVSLTIKRGDFISIVGHSGSGKTTLLSMIGGITTPTSGRILFEDRDLYSLGRDELSTYRCEKIGFMFQFASLLPMLTVKENLLLPTVFRSDEGNREVHQWGEKAVSLLRKVGLGDKINTYPSQLSGGQQRRVAIARAFMNDPALILADEPTGDLDEDTEQEMINLFRIMNQSEGITFIIVTHNTDIAKQSKYQFRMHNGSIQKQ